MAAGKQKGLSQAQYAQHRLDTYGHEVTRQYIGKLVKKGVIPVLKNRRIDPQAADAAMDAHVKWQKPSERKATGLPLTVSDPEAKGPDGQPLSLNQVKLDREYYKSAQARLNYEAEAGRLIEKEKVVRAAEGAARVFTQQVMGWPSKMAPVLAPLSDEREIAATLKTECRALIDEITQSLRRLYDND